jgi:hypothetical protein
MAIVHELCAIRGALFFALLQNGSHRCTYLKVPRAVAQDSLLYTWKSYSESLKYVIEEQAVEADLNKQVVSTLQVYGDQ